MKEKNELARKKNLENVKKELEYLNIPDFYENSKLI